MAKQTSTEEDPQGYTVSTHTSLNRPLLLVGGDRELMASSLGLGILLILTMQSVVGLIIGIALASILTYLVRKATLADPQFRPIWTKSFRYGKYFPAQAHYTAQVPEIRKVADL
jgi:type IV secretion system protein VirB3